MARFEPEDLPPPLPSDELFALNPTTIVVVAESPDKIGNVLIEEIRRKATMQKVSRRKFTIVATTLDEILGCKVKIRVYAAENGSKCAVEFQRRAGDCIAFNRLFREMRDIFAMMYMLTRWCALPSQAACHTIVWSDFKFLVSDLPKYINNRNLWQTPGPRKSNGKKLELKQEREW
jgi:hypothetical protein